MTDISYPLYLFHEGTNFQLHNFLGVTLAFDDGRYVYTFRVWAPNAKRVGLISDFSGWENPLFLNRIDPCGIFELVYTSEYSLERQPYKYRIYTDDDVFDKGDPFAKFSRGGWDGASLIFAENHFVWSDGDWLGRRSESVFAAQGYLSSPINIYEMHLGSFLRHFNGQYYSYVQLAEILPEYLKRMGYTHVEFLPLQEFPYDGSWGYQVCGFFAPTSRFGDPDELKHLINALHNAGIGVILDWVCAHLPKDEWGLSKFDGSFLYEYSDQNRREARRWGTSYFDLSKPEVRSFLISNALYFIREFHLDGLRVDAASHILYFDGFGLDSEGRSIDRKNDVGVEFFKKLNSAVASEFPDVMMIAEDSSCYEGLTAPLSDGGLGFSLKWNMGWAHDFFDYVSTDPYHRVQKHRALNFPLVYAFKEKHCMPISHDEVSSGKRAFVEKMFGEFEDKLAMARLSIMLMMTYPGKKLTFMGTEFAQFSEWNYNRELEWFMLKYPNHTAFSDYISAINRFYLGTPELWQIDFSQDGFSWLCPDESEKNLVAFNRISSSGSKITVVLNFSGIEQTVTIPAAKDHDYKVMFDTGNLAGGLHINNYHSNGGHFAAITLPRYGGVILN